MDKFDPTPALRHGAAERLRFIDSRLFWEARINRADLIDAFAISPAQAALDFREYLKLCSGAVAYDTRLKAYVAGPGFTPVFGVPDATSTLKSLGEAGDRWTCRLPELERPLDPAVAARVRRAARDGERLLVDYQSFTRPSATRRWITHASDQRRPPVARARLELRTPGMAGLRIGAGHADSRGRARGRAAGRHGLDQFDRSSSCDPRAGCHRVKEPRWRGVRDGRRKAVD